MISTTTGIVNNKDNEVLLNMTNINLIYPTGETVHDLNKLKYYSNQNLVSHLQEMIIVCFYLYLYTFYLRLKQNMD